MSKETNQFQEFPFATTYVFPSSQTPLAQPIKSTTLIRMETLAPPITSGDLPTPSHSKTSQKPPLQKTVSLGRGTLEFVNESDGENKEIGRSSSGLGPQVCVVNPYSFTPSGGVKVPQKSSLKKGHSRSASHGGVMGARPGLPSDPTSTVPQLPSALKKGHTRAASHGQIVEDLTQNNFKGHSRTQSKTDFILPPGHQERTTQPPPHFEKGHSRQASRSESIYTLRADKKVESKWIFWKRNQTETPKTRIIIPNHVSSSVLTNANYPTNHIRTTKYTPLSFLPKNLFEQFHRFANLYFLSIVLLNWIPAISAFGKEIAMLPVMFVLGVTAIKDLFEDRRRHRSDKRINNSFCRVYNTDLRRYAKVKWKNMRVGDFIHLSCNEMIPADILILRTSDANGLCYIETMNLDGESNLKQRQVIRDHVERQSTFQPQDFVSEIQVGGPTTKIYHFGGYVSHPDGSRIPITKENLLLRDCVLKNTDYIEGIVIYAGRETKAMLNNGGPRHKRTGLEKMMNLEVMWCVVLLAIMCIVGATGSSLWFISYTNPLVPFANPQKEPRDTGTNVNPIYEAFLSFLTYIIILQVMIPLSLYVTIELTKLMQIYHIQNDVELYDEETNKGIECRAMNIPEDLGQIQYVFSDKTGTLTENKMLFRRCTIGAIDYNHSPSELEEMSRASQLPMLIVNPSLSELLGQLNIQLSIESGNMEVDFTAQAKRVHDFFMILAVCNTVVVAKYPHHDKMNASGLIVEGNQTIPTSRLSTIRETLDVLSTPPVYVTQDQQNLLLEESPSAMMMSSQRFRRPGKLDLPQIRPLSPISSSNETTPTDSPAQRIRRIPLPNFTGFRRTLNISNNHPPPPLPATPTPSPSELRPIFEAESPDELALVEAAYAYHCKLLKRTPNHVRVAMPGEGLLEYDVLHTFPFDSTRKRMSIIVRHPCMEGIILYCKGADSSIFPNLRSTNVAAEIEMIEQTQQNINNYAREGLRILVMAKRHISLLEYNEWLLKFEAAETDMNNRDNLLTQSYNLLERNLELVGATGIEDRLQEGVPETIEAIRKAGIVVWVLTGDKQETAVNIAYSCRLFTPNMDIIKINAKSKSAAGDTITFYLDQIERVKKNENPFDEFPLGRNLETPPLTDAKERALVVDGKTLTYILDQRNSNLLQPFLSLTKHCSAVLCCRATPLQKAFIVSSVKDHLRMRTLAIGDGANDVSMIQRADVGVGISGKEGMQAVMASDFAIAKFKFLERLLLVHGHWCYDRLARMILYFFYKNAAFVFVIFWYQLLNGWSGSVMIDQMYLMVFNLIFTALPPMAMGIYDQDASAKLLLAVPQLYRQGRLRKIHTAHSFWWNMLDALYASVVIFFVAYGAYKGSDIGMIEFGTTITVSCMFTMLGNMVVEAKSWTILHVVSVVGSIIFFYAFALLYNSLCMNLLGIQTPCQVIQLLMKTPTHWLVIFVTVVMAVLPRFVFRLLQNTVDPSDVVRAILHQRNQKQESNEEFFVSWSRSLSNSSVFKEKPSFLCWRKTKVQNGCGGSVPMTASA